MDALGTRQQALLAAAPRVVNIALAGVLAYLVTLQLVQWVGPDRASQVQPALSVSSHSQVSGAAADYARRIDALHLFGTAQPATTADRAVAESAGPIPDTPLKLILRGILDAHDTAFVPWAIIQDERSTDERHFKIGDSLFGLATLREIHADRVIIERNGRYETLRLPERALAGIERRAPAQAAVPAQMSGVEYVGFMQRQMRELHATTLESERNPWQYLYYEPAMVNGKIMGLKLSAEEERAFLARHGLELGDTIVSINGSDVDGAGGLVNALDAISTAEELTFVVERQGSRKTIHIKN